jgi:hypothetical protein
MNEAAFLLPLNHSDSPAVNPEWVKIQIDAGTSDCGHLLLPVSHDKRPQRRSTSTMLTADEGARAKVKIRQCGEKKGSVAKLHQTLPRNRAE